MDDDSELSKEFIRAFAKQIASDLYCDMKMYLPTAYRRLKKVVLQAQRPKFRSVSLLADAISDGRLVDGQLISVNCRPMQFSPFFRRHFLGIASGFLEYGRKGPVLGPAGSPNQLLSQLAHLRPCGILPAIDREAGHYCLYDAQIPLIGLSSPLGNVPGQSFDAPYIFSVMPTVWGGCLGKLAKITAVLRQVLPDDFRRLGYAAESAEIFRRQGACWFLDSMHPDACFEVLDEEGPPEFWAGLYAQGHIELASGEFQTENVLRRTISLLNENGIDAKRVHNRAPNATNSMLYGDGFRVHYDTSWSGFSIHADVELIAGYSESHSNFLNNTKRVLQAFNDVASESGAELINPYDLDYSYANSESMFDVLQSDAAKLISDPVLLAIRDWHKTRVS